MLILLNKKLYTTPVREPRRFCGRNLEYWGFIITLISFTLVATKTQITHHDGSACILLFVPCKVQIISKGSKLEALSVIRVLGARFTGLLPSASTGTRSLPTWSVFIRKWTCWIITLFISILNSTIIHLLCISFFICGKILEKWGLCGNSIALR
jgi:hypothetical protein